MKTCREKPVLWACQDALETFYSNHDGVILWNDIEKFLLLQIAFDTREMLLLARENQDYIRKTMGYNADGSDAQGTAGEGNDTANGSNARSEPRYDTD